MKSIRKLAILGTLIFSVRAIAVDLMPEAMKWMGEYSQASAIHFTGPGDEKSCQLEAPDAKWDGRVCVETTQNKINISKVSDDKTGEKYLVQIGIIGGNIHTCDFAGEMTLQNDRLVYQDVIPDRKEICRIEIEHQGTGLKMAARDNCSEYYCGFGLVLTGTDQVFKRTGAGHEVTSQTAKQQEQE